MNYPERCGKCEACTFINDSKKFYIPGPNEHADSLTVSCWNDLIWNNPCEHWKIKKGDGKRIVTIFIVQCSKNKNAKSSYENKYTFRTDMVTNPEGQALFYYRSLNIGYGYKKRLIRIDVWEDLYTKEKSETKNILMRQFS